MRTFALTAREPGANALVVDGDFAAMRVNGAWRPKGKVEVLTVEDVRSMFPLKASRRVAEALIREARAALAAVARQ